MFKLYATNRPLETGTAALAAAPSATPDALSRVPILHNVFIDEF